MWSSLTIGLRESEYQIGFHASMINWQLQMPQKTACAQLEKTLV